MKWKKSLTLATMAAALLSAPMWAVPAKRITKSVTQSDGTVLRVTLVGDEYCHYFITEDSIPVREGEDGYFYYIEGDSLTLSTVEAHSSSIRNEVERKFLEHNTELVKSNLRRFGQQRREYRNRGRRRRIAAPTIQTKDTLTTDDTSGESSVRRSVGVTTGLYEGKKKGLVILVNFQDVSMVHTREEFYNMLNQEGYSLNGSVGSARDYFMDQSYNKFQPEFDVVGPYTVSQKMSYYGANDPTTGYDTKPEVMVKEACQKANSDVNFSDYDWDGDGNVDLVYVFFAGYDESENGPSNAIWAHSQDGLSLKLDGVYVTEYACSGELKGNSGSQLRGIGTFCHEFSHVLGLRDTYDTENGKSSSMLNWDLMYYGNYNGDGYVPCGYTAFERWSVGWLTPVELKEKLYVTDMKALTQSPDAYVLFNDNNRNEYYLLENRQLDKWDSKLPGHGMLVTHVDYNETAWKNNVINNTVSHQRYAVVPADNNTTWTDAGMAGDPYPGTSGNSSLTNTTTPAATLFNKNTDGTYYLNKPIYNISENNGVISFSVMEENVVDTPQPLSATQVTDDSFTARWNGVEEADRYEVELSVTLPNPNSGYLIDEDFSGFPAGSTVPTNVSTKLDSYTQIAGWTGENVYVRSGKVQIGSNAITGWLQTPPCTSSHSTFYVSITVTPASSSVSSPTYKLYIYNEKNEKLGYYTFTLSSSETTILKATLNSDTSPYSFRLEPSTRSYISQFTVTSTEDGSGDEADIVGTYDTTDTEYSFSGLTESQYYYRVRAIKYGIYSPWSDYITVPMGLLVGDADGNGEITVGDITAVAAYILDNGSDINVTAADADGNGEITVGDITTIAAKILNNESTK
jgi:M6 family metalloprotease-like protein